MKRSEVLDDWLRSTSIHGLPHVGTALNPFVKAFWVVVLVTSLAVLGYQTNNLINQFNSKPVFVNIKVHSGGFEFPAVTLCNLNAFKKSQIYLVPQIEELEKALSIVQNQSAQEAIRRQEEGNKRRKRGVAPNVDHNRSVDRMLIRDKRAVTEPPIHPPSTNAELTTEALLTTEKLDLNFTDICAPLYSKQLGTIVRTYLKGRDGKRCYKQYTKEMSYSAAHAYCVKEAAEYDNTRGRLASFFGKEAELSDLFEEYKLHAPKTDYPTLPDYSKEKHWVALKNTKGVTSVDWRLDWGWMEGGILYGCPEYRPTGFKVGREGNNCMTVLGPNHWFDAPCNEKNWFLCEFIDNTILPPAVTCEEYPEEIQGVEGLCTAHGGVFNQITYTCFLLVDNVQLSWNDTFQYCSDLTSDPTIRARLAQIPADKDWLTIKDNISWASGPWIGGRAVNPECGYNLTEHWRFYDSPEHPTACLTYGVPFDIGDSEYCVKVINSQGYTTDDCEIERSFVCEFLPAETTISGPPTKCDSLSIYEWQCQCLGLGATWYKSPVSGCFQEFEGDMTHDEAYQACNATVNDFNANHPATRFIPMRARLGNMLGFSMWNEYVSTDTWVGLKTTNEECPRDDRKWIWEDPPDSYIRCTVRTGHFSDVHIPLQGDYCLTAGADNTLIANYCNSTRPKRLCEFYPGKPINYNRITKHECFLFFQTDPVLFQFHVQA